MTSKTVRFFGPPCIQVGLCFMWNSEMLHFTSLFSPFYLNLNDNLLNFVALVKNYNTGKENV